MEITTIKLPTLNLLPTQKFEINNKQVEKFKYFSVIQDFYKNPDEVVNFINQFESLYFKHPKGYFSQGVEFHDKRHEIYTYEIKPVWDFLSSVTKQKPHGGHNVEYAVFTNHTKFEKIYTDKYYYPHKDLGYTCLVYLNKGVSNGTNFYNDKGYTYQEEHKQHWATDQDVEVVAHAQSEYNKLIIWNGDRYHGLCMDERYIKEWRLNQVFFFEKTQNPQIIKT